MAKSIHRRRFCFPRRLCLCTPLRRDAMSLIDTILVDTKARLEARKRLRSSSELTARAHDARRATTTFREAIESKAFSMIAEVKRRSPSSGKMDEDNVSRALAVYDDTPSVSAVSILTDEDHF